MPCLSHGTDLYHGKRIKFIHVWQSRVENEHYSVAYFDRIRVFKAPYLRTSVKGGAHMRYVVASICEASTQHI